MLSRGEMILRFMLSIFHPKHIIFNVAGFQAINMMLSQPRGGHIFNIDGAGSDGRPTPRCACFLI